MHFVYPNLGSVRDNLWITFLTKKYLVSKQSYSLYNYHNYNQESILFLNSAIIEILIIM